jgi:RNA polymerase sigma-70 factor (TIGR02943 family)
MGIPSEDLPRMRSYLLRYATLQLRDPALAEDVVQETLLAAFNSPSRFSGKSAYKTWLVGILKHKIVDVVRKRSRDQSLFAAEETPEPETAEEYFAADGHWREFPSKWGNPEQSLEDKRFWEVFERCLEAMPARAARAFMMREFMELTSDEICKELAITPTNLWVLLHRARLSLRGCLEAKWFDGATGQKRC